MRAGDLRAAAGEVRDAVRDPMGFYSRLPEAALGVAVGLAALAGLIIRLVELGDRPLHHDESLDAWYSWRFLGGTFEGYDPVYHGPLRFYLTGAVFWVFGESHTTARLVAVLAGTALIALPWFLRSALGHGATLATSVILALSPSIVYVTRFGREDSLAALTTVGMIVAIIRFSEQPRVRWAVLFAIMLASGFAVKETTFITLFIFGSFLLAVLVEQAVEWIRVPRSEAVEALIDGQWQELDVEWRQVRGSAAVEAVVDGQWQEIEVRRREAPGSGAGAAETARWAWMLPVGLLPMALAFFVSGRFGVEIFLALGLYGLLMAGLLLALAAPLDVWDLPIVRLARQVSGRGWLLAAGVFLLFFALWFTVLFELPSGFFDGFTEGITYWRGEQDTGRGGEPWYYYLYTVPLYEYLMVGLAAVGAVHVFRHPSMMGKLMVWMAVASWLSYSWASERFPWLVLHLLVPMSFLAGYGIRSIWQVCRRRRGLSVLAGAVIVALLATTLYTTYTLNYVRQRDPRELLTQVHTTYDYVDTVRRIDALNQYSQSIGEGSVAVSIDTSLSVPSLWYFRDYQPLAWVDGAVQPDAPADFILFRSPGNLAAVPELVGYQFTTVELRDWWAPQFESYHDGWFSGWARWLVDREVWNGDTTLGSFNMDIGISPRALELEARMAAGG